MVVWPCGDQPAWGIVYIKIKAKIKSNILICMVHVVINFIQVHKVWLISYKNSKKKYSQFSLLLSDM